MEMGFQGDFAPLFKAFTTNSYRLWKLLEDGEIKREFLKIERFRKTLEESSITGDPLAWSQIYLKGLCKKADYLDGALEVHRFLKNKNHSVGLVTNGIGSVQNARMKDSPLLTNSDFMLTSDPPFRPKPAKDLFLEALRLWSEPSPKNVIMVGDNLVCDIQGAQNLGFATCWISGESHQQEFYSESDELRSIKPTMSFPSVNDLLESIKGS